MVREIRWSTSRPRHEPPAGAATAVAVDDALLTPLTRGGLRTEVGPRRWVAGAVHESDGTLVAASQRLWHGDRLTPIAADPARVPVPGKVRRLGGTWVYAGHWSNHFGHFLLETMSTLWPDPTGLGEVTGVLAHRPIRGHLPPPTARTRLEDPTLTSWQGDLLRLAGYADRDVRVVHGRALRVERLVVPSRTTLLRSWARPEAVQAWHRIGDAVGERGPHRRVYLSRTLFHARGDHSSSRRVRAEEEWDAALDTAFATAGFVVVHPETLPVAEQIATVRGADVLAGLSGSALHLSVFARPGTRVLEVGDQRAATEPMPTQLMVDAACGHRTAFVAYRDRPGLAAALDTLDG